MQIQIDVFTIIIVTILSLIGVPFYLYVLTRLITTAVCKSYFEVKQEFKIFKEE